MALRSLAIESPNNFLILSGVSEEKVDEMVTAAKALAQDDSSKQQLQSLIKEKRREAEKAKDWKRMALFLHLNQMLDSEDLR